MATPPTDFMPELAGFSIQAKRTPIDSVLIQQSANFELRASLREEMLWRYTLTLGLAVRHLTAWAAGNELAKLLQFWTIKGGRRGTFLFVDPVSGTMRKEYIGTGDGSKKVFTLTDLDGFTAKHIQSIAVFSEIVRHVPPTTMPWGLANNAQWEYSSFEDGAAPVVIEVTPGETVKVSATGAVKYSPESPEFGPAGGASPVTGYTLPSDLAGASSLTRFAGLVGAFCNGSGHVIQPVFIGAGGTWVVPANATRLQLGINDFHFNDNSGDGFTATVTRSSRNAITTSEYSVNSNAGHITFDDAPQLGERLMWDGVCAKVVRFDSSLDIDRLMSEIYAGGGDIVLFTPPGAQ